MNLIKTLTIILLELLSVKVAHTQWALTSLPSGSEGQCFFSSDKELYAGMGASAETLWHTNLYRSSDEGFSWNRCDSGLQNVYAFGSGISLDSSLFVGTIESGIFLSSNGARTWDSISASFNVWALASLDSDIFAGTDEGVYISTNYGQNWFLANTGWPTNKIVGVSSFATNGREIYTGSLFGMVLSTDHGTTWTQ